MKNIVVIGMHRSGTSMVAGALARAGLFAGSDDELLVDQEDNPNGFWERTDVVELDDAILAASGGAWFNPPAELVDSAAHSEAAKKILARLGVEAPWLVKDPRMVITWPSWEALLGDALPVFVYRNPVSVAISLQRRNRFPLTLSFALWEHYNRRCLEILEGRDCTTSTPTR